MKTSLHWLDRTSTGLAGVGLVGAALIALDWRYRLMFDGYPDALSTDQIGSTITSGWWPWGLTAVAVLLALLAVWWLMTHLRREGPSLLRLRASNSTGRLEADARSFADAAADSFADRVPSADVHGRTLTHRSVTWLDVTGTVGDSAEPTEVLEATRTCADDVRNAFPDDRVQVRVCLQAPRPRRMSRRPSHVRVH